MTACDLTRGIPERDADREMFGGCLRPLSEVEYWDDDDDPEHFDLQTVQDSATTNPR
jgi:hypothetical protein